jgi:alkylation response protein AidB-like acyl-CoA dehydrogenase
MYDAYPAPSDRAVALHAELVDFMGSEVFPAEAAYDAYRQQVGPEDHTVPPVIEELKRKARARGLWNLFLPSESGLTQLEYAGLAELSGWSNELAPEAMNCQAPDTGNMELLHLIGTEEQQRRWLDPLLGPLDHHLQCPLSRAERAHHVVDPTGTQARLGRGEPAALLPEQVRHRHPDVVELHDAVPVLVLAAEDRVGAPDPDPGGVGGHDDHRLLAVGGRRGVGLAHRDEQRAARVCGAAAPPLGPVDHVLVTVEHQARGDVGGVGAGDRRLGHREGRADLAAQQRVEPPSLPVMGAQHFQAHCEITFTDARVPVSNVLGVDGGGFAAAQARLGPGRIHHVMRALGSGERALALMAKRSKERVAFGKPLAKRDSVRQEIAESRIALDQARALCHHAAYVIDSEGNKAARHLVAEAKVAVPRTVLAVIDRAIQLHGGAGVSNDTPLAELWAWHRAMRLFDGPDEVHLMTLGRAELLREPLFDV